VRKVAKREEEEELICILPYALQQYLVSRFFLSSAARSIDEELSRNRSNDQIDASSCIEQSRSSRHVPHRAGLSIPFRFRINANGISANGVTASRLSVLLL
jgi:hypothetical protein